MIVMITGGARSGKSSFAERLAVRMADSCGASGYYAATAEAGDREMADRIAQHAARREQAMPGWKTIEEPYETAEALRDIRRSSGAGIKTVVLVDCLTLWLSNWLLRTEHDDPQSHIERQLDELLAAAEAIDGHVLFVTNEVGDGLVPEYSLGRLYRDMAGWMNQRVASRADKVFLVTAGIPIELKSLQADITKERF